MTSTPRLAPAPYWKTSSNNQLARLSLTLLAVMVSASCLLVGEPDTTPLQAGHPELRAVAPAQTELFYAEWNDEQTFPAITFRAQVRSEDAGQPLEAALLIDYGQLGPGGTPWREGITLPSVQAGTSADGWRDFTNTWRPGNGLASGCHTVTLVVSHQFDKLGGEHRLWCPLDPDDGDTLTWFVQLCKDPNNCPFEGCPVYGDPNTPTTYCDSAPALDGGT